MAEANIKWADESDRAELIDILTQAFHDDPVMHWSCNNPSSLAGFFDVTLTPFLPHKLSYLDSQGRGAAVWLGPDQKLKWPITWASLVNVIKLGGAKGIVRMLRSGYATEKHHPKTPHYYLFAIGVAPQYKGQGLGSGLISTLLRRCDDEGVPAYLENSKKENLPFYEGHGFKVLKKIRFAPSAPPVWLMWREPVTARP